MESHNVWRLKMTLWVLVAFPAPSDFVVQLGGRQGSQVGRVGTGDADSVVCSEEERKMIHDASKR